MKIAVGVFVIMRLHCIILPDTGVINLSTADLPPYSSSLEPYLTQLGSVLGIVDHALAIEEGSAWLSKCKGLVDY